MIPGRSGPGLLAVCVVTIALGGCRLANDHDPSLSLAREAETIIRDYGLPGMTLAVAGPQALTVAAAGLANREADEPMSAVSTMLAASIGKTFVAATVLQLADQGRLEIDAPLEKWLGRRDWFDRLPNARAITLRHLLGHRAGLPDHVRLASFRALWPQSNELLSPEELIALILDMDPLFPPGEAMAYSDTGYLLLGMVIEEVAGQPVEKLIEDRFILPLGLESTGASNKKDLPGLARGYASSASGLALPERTTDEAGRMLWNPAVEWTGGGLYSTARDLAHWGREFLSGRLLSETTYRAALLNGQVIEPDSAGAYGLGIALRYSNEFGPVYGHRGWIPGYVSSLQYYADHDTAIAFQINTDIGFIDADRPTMAEIEARLARMVLANLND